MARNAAFFTRMLADLFPGKPAAPGHAAVPTTPTPQTTPPRTAPVTNASPQVIGQGAANETHITIADEPHLFVEESQYVVQFRPAFDERPSETPFGLKILPELTPHWSQVHVHRCSLKDALSAAIRSGGKPIVTVAAPKTSRAEASGPRQGPDEPPDITPARTTSSRGHSHDTGAVRGRVISWGEEQFPDRNKPGRFYDSFAMHIETATGERTLQGEGLKEAIAHARCHVGDYVSVRRLRTIQVPAIRRDGSPKIVDGKQVMWDKWLWSISK